MTFKKTLTVCMAALAVVLCLPAAHASDEAVMAAQEAFRGKNATRLAALLPKTQGDLLEPWVAYWEQTVRIAGGGSGSAKFDEFRGFAQTYPGAYVTDRLRNDWLLELGRRRDWAAFAEELPNFVMRDDPQVDCYDITRRLGNGEDVAAAGFELWMKNRDFEACHAMGEALLAAGKLTQAQAWERARRAVEHERVRTAARVAAYLPAPAAAQIGAAYESPARFLIKHQLNSPVERNMAVLALARMARQGPESAVQWLNENGGRLAAEDRAFVWGLIGRHTAQNLDNQAARYFAQTGNFAQSDEVLAWKVRAALRAKDWQQVLAAVPLMSDEQLRDSAWTYWHAIAHANNGKNAKPDAAAELFKAIATPFTFYGLLATEELGRPIVLPVVAPPTPEAVTAARARPGIARALKLFSLGLRGEAIREWNFMLRGMSDLEIQAIAEVACQAQIWDRCINTSDRTRELIDVRQRYAMPFREAIRAGSANAGLEEAYVYGLIRQESRFLVTARSSVGAGGLMQLMPATASWTAKKMGVDMSAGVNDVGVNVALGTAYLRMLKDEFEGSEALAAAGYNAGPGRPRKWRTMGVGMGDGLGKNSSRMDAAAFAENVPFAETRDYIKKVLSNATVYAAMITGKPQSLKARLGAIGARGLGLPSENKDLP